jgi:hypothetical protein
MGAVSSHHNEGKVKTKGQQRRRALSVSSAFFLALLLGHFPHLSAEERRADRLIVEPSERKTLKTNEAPMKPESAHEPMGLVGPSAQQIHDFLYPPAKDDKVVGPMN